MHALVDYLELRSVLGLQEAIVWTGPRPNGADERLPSGSLNR
jgi:hypothetical protein